MKKWLTIIIVAVITAVVVRYGLKALLPDLDSKINSLLCGVSSALVALYIVTRKGT